MMIEAKKSKEDYFEGRASCSDIGKKRKEWIQLWNMKLPSKVKVFCWRLALNSLPTASVLESRNMSKNVAPGFKNKIRYAVYVSPESQISLLTYSYK